MGFATFRRRRTVALVRALGTTEVASLVQAVMIRSPKVLPASATVGEVRAQLRDDHVHMVLLVSSSAYGVTADDGHRRLTGTLVRDDVPPTLADEEPALPHASLTDRTVHPDAHASDVQHRLALGGERRLAVVDADGDLVGLLCLKRHGRGFCADENVHARAAENVNPHVVPTDAATWLSSPS
jgi:CBS-domain-containing membrane protein